MSDPDNLDFADTQTLAHPECCGKTNQQSDSADILALGTVMKELMENGEEGVFDMLEPGKWSAEAVDFKDATMTTPAKELAEVSYRTRRVEDVLTMQHVFIKGLPQTNELVRLVFLAQLSAYRIYTKNFRQAPRS